MKPGFVFHTVDESAQGKPSGHALQHIPLPFTGQMEIHIKRKGRVNVVHAERASSVIEIFQSACYRSYRDLIQPLVLQFDDPCIQYFCLQNYLVPLEQILVEYGTNRVVNASVLRFDPGRQIGNHIRAFAGMSCVILAKPGFAEEFHIDRHKTIIHLKSLHHAQQA